MSREFRDCDAALADEIKATDHLLHKRRAKRSLIRSYFQVDLCLQIDENLSLRSLSAVKT